MPAADGANRPLGEDRFATMPGRGPTIGDALTPQQVDGVTDVREIFVGGEAVCALGTSGSLHCWGNGPIGDGTAHAQFRPRVVFESGIIHIATAGAFSCVILAARNVACWGQRPGGEPLYIGDGSTSGAVSPQILRPPT